MSESFDLDPYTRWRLLEGLDDIGLTLAHEAAIDGYAEGIALNRDCGRQSLDRKLSIEHGKAQAQHRVRGRDRCSEKQRERTRPRGGDVSHRDQQEPDRHQACPADTVEQHAGRQARRPLPGAEHGGDQRHHPVVCPERRLQVDRHRGPQHALPEIEEERRHEHAERGGSPLGHHAVGRTGVLRASERGTARVAKSMILHIKG